MPSSVIRAFRYHPAGRRLDIVFVTGRLYSYYDVPPDVYGAMRNAFSKGEFFNAHIRDRYRYTRQRSALAK
ncbi:MAG TPA: KTSC domain-containing protein [Rhizomicrobium sp.]|nr:KTSC domain-containing protein [Rhizomicrobium sp.]